MAEFLMPSLGADMEAGTILEWMVKVGDPIKRGDIIAVVDTEKATIEVEVFQTGMVEAILVPVGEKVPVGTALAMIREAGAAAMPAQPTKPAVVPPVMPARPPLVSVTPTSAVELARAAAPKPLPPVPIARPPMTHRPRISPLARRLAAELHVDIASVPGTGLGGAIGKRDIEQAAKMPAEVTAGPVSPPVERRTPMAKSEVAPADRQAAMRRAIAAAMSRSKREIPHYYLGTSIDMSVSLAWLQAENQKRSVTDRILYSVLLLKAVALAVREVPEVNGFWIDNEIKLSEAVHVGVAIALRQGGLIAPAIHDVDQKGLDEIMTNLRDLVKRVRLGVLRSSEVADATITVSSLGEQGVESVFGVIYPPQVALVGFGKIVERPWAVNGMLGVRPIMMASLAGDHRVSDGHRGGLFLAAIDRLLQDPEKLCGTTKSKP